MFGVIKLIIEFLFIFFINRFMEFFKKNEFWLLVFSGGLLYWLFNPSVVMTLVMIIPLLLAANAKK